MLEFLTSKRVSGRKLDVAVASTFWMSFFEVFLTSKESFMEKTNKNQEKHKQFTALRFSTKSILFVCFNSKRIVKT